MNPFTDLLALLFLVAMGIGMAWLALTGGLRDGSEL